MTFDVPTELDKPNCYGIQLSFIFRIYMNCRFAKLFRFFPDSWRVECSMSYFDSGVYECPFWQVVLIRIVESAGIVGMAVFVAGAKMC